MCSIYVVYGLCVLGCTYNTTYDVSILEMTMHTIHSYTLLSYTYMYTAIQDLAKMLVEKAREVSIDTNRDSPFAVLAKENDVMWGGGMPDDTSVSLIMSAVYMISIMYRFECICLCMHRSIVYDVYVITLTVCYIFIGGCRAYIQ